MNYNANDEPIYKDLPRKEAEPIVLDWSRGTKYVSREMVNELLEKLKEIEKYKTREMF